MPAFCSLFLVFFIIANISWKIILGSFVSGAGGGGDIKRICVCWWWWFFFFSAASSSLARTTSVPSSISSDIRTHFIVVKNQNFHGNINNIHHGRSRSRLIVILAASSAAIILMGFFTLCIARRRRRCSKRVEDAEMPVDDSAIISQPPVIRRFSWGEIVAMSSRDLSTVVGQGGFSTVYRSFDSQSALKIYPKSERLSRVFKQELDILLHLRHPNIVKLHGYCGDEDQDEVGGALVFEFIPNGSLHEKLHGNGEKEMTWKSRMWIAFQLARAIQYLHDKCAFPIVHGDIKPSNLLLDNQLNCKLCDFGSAKMGFFAPPSSQSLMGSPGYIDPHYIRTGMASTKNDVYSFGVILLELITGIEAFCPEKEQLLTSIAGDVVDLRPLMGWAVDLGPSDSEEVMVMASVSAMCLRKQPSLRPSMADILTTMTNKLPSLSSFIK